ncbi:MAG: hypothetical protein HGB04_00505 [Chlorobiaceae bacterium]|nr:hypothetical protein [Chlorobiaceae bacterium]
MKTHSRQNTGIYSARRRSAMRAGWRFTAQLLLFAAALMPVLPSRLEAANLTSTIPVALSPTMTEILSGLNLSSTQPQAEFSGTSTFNGGTVSGTGMVLAQNNMTYTITNIPLWTFTSGNSNASPSASFSLSNNPLQKSSGSVQSKISITVAPAATKPWTKSQNRNTYTYTGYVDITLDLSNTKLSGKHTNTTISISVNNL